MNTFAHGQLSDLADLVQQDRVHGSIYTDPHIFEREIDRIYHRSWVCLGHVSELPAAGDYRATRIGRQPVIMVLSLIHI